MKLLELDSYNMENDRTFLKSIEEHVKDPYIRERLINRLEWYMVMANRCQCFYIYVCLYGNCYADSHTSSEFHSGQHAFRRDAAAVYHGIIRFVGYCWRFIRHFRMA